MIIWKEHILKKIEPHFLEREELLWYSGSLEDKKKQDRENQILAPENFPFTLFFLLASFFLLVITITFEFGSPTLIFLEVGSIIILMYFAFSKKAPLTNFEEETFPFTAITNEHVFVHKNGKTSHSSLKDYSVIETTIGVSPKQMLLLNHRKHAIVLPGHYEIRSSIKQVYTILASQRNDLSPLAKKIATKYGLKPISSITDATVLIGKYKEFWIETRWPDRIPIDLFYIHISCPNPLDTHFSISPETMGSNLKKLVNMKDIKIGDANFDTNFLLKTDNSQLLKSILSSKTKSIIEKNNKYASCSLTFGDTNKQTPNIQANKSQYQDQADVLDFQLLKQSEDQPELYADYNKNLVSKLKLEANIRPDYHDFHKTAELIILNGFNTVIAMAEAMEVYHKTIGK